MTESLLHSPAVVRIAGGQASGEHMVALFETLAKEANELDQDNMVLAVQYIESGDEILPGTYIPELILVVRRVGND